MQICKRDFTRRCQKLINKISTALNQELKKNPANLILHYKVQPEKLKETDRLGKPVLLGMAESHTLLCEHLIFVSVQSMVKSMQEVIKPLEGARLSDDKKQFCRRRLIAQYNAFSLADGISMGDNFADAEKYFKIENTEEALLRRNALWGSKIKTWREGIKVWSNEDLAGVSETRLFLLDTLYRTAYHALAFEQKLIHPITQQPLKPSELLNFYDSLNELHVRATLLSVIDEKNVVSAYLSKISKDNKNERRTLNDKKPEILAAIAFWRSVNWIRSKNEASDFIQFLKDHKGKIIKLGFKNKLNKKSISITSIPGTKAAQRRLDKAFSFKSTYSI